MTKRPSLCLAFVFGAAMVAIPRIVSADCPFTVRPANAEEKKIYADGFALFQRVAPPTPSGWEARDAQKDGVLTEVCTNGQQKVTLFHFSRSYSRQEGMEARRAEEMKKTLAVVQDGQSATKANAAKLADAQKRMEALQKKMQELVAAKRYQELEPLNVQIDAVMKEQAKLMSVDAQQEALDAIKAEASRDVQASFSLTVGDTDLNPSTFSPVTVGGIRALRQLVPAQRASPAHADFMVVLNPAAASKTVVRISGDPARAEELLKAAKLQ